MKGRLGPSKRVGFPLEPADDLSHDLEDSLTAVDSGLELIAVPNVANLGGWKDEIKGDKLVVAVDLHHEEVVHAEEFDLLAGPAAEGSALLHGPRTEGRGPGSEAKPLLSHATSGGDQAEVTALALGVAGGDSDADAVREAAERQRRRDLICRSVGGSISERTRAPLRLLHLNGGVQVLFADQRARNDDVLLRVHLLIRGLHQSIDEHILIAWVGARVVLRSASNCNHRSSNGLLPISESDNVLAQNPSLFVDLLEGQALQRLLRLNVRLLRRHESVAARNCLHQIPQLIRVRYAVPLGRDLRGVGEAGPSVALDLRNRKTVQSEAFYFAHGQLDGLPPPSGLGHQVERTHGAAFPRAIELVELDESERRALSPRRNVEPDLHRRQDDPPRDGSYEVLHCHDRSDPPLREEVEGETLKELVLENVGPYRASGGEAYLGKVVESLVVHIVPVLKMKVVRRLRFVPAPLPLLAPLVHRRRKVPRLLRLDRPRYLPREALRLLPLVFLQLRPVLLRAQATELLPDVTLDVRNVDVSNHVQQDVIGPVMSPMKLNDVLTSPRFNQILLSDREPLRESVLPVKCAKYLALNAVLDSIYHSHFRQDSLPLFLQARVLTGRLHDLRECVEG
mmetsp:Transcript_2151/g.3886  ORF Transcript_2151/g.3886 Transcript_2151/m.3886 type:complete len:624 (+) Transcript_2151:1190-3061(+)